MIRRKARQIELDDKPYLIWNAFIDIVAMEIEKDLNKIQINAQKAFIYDSEVQNENIYNFLRIQN